MHGSFLTFLSVFDSLVKCVQTTELNSCQVFGALVSDWFEFLIHIHDKL